MSTRELAPRRIATASARTDAAIATTAVRRDLRVGGGGGGVDGEEEPFPLAAAVAPGGAVAASGERVARERVAIGEGRKEGGGRVLCGRWDLSPIHHHSLI